MFSPKHPDQFWGLLTIQLSG